jgi:subtilisin family serine protease
MSTQDDRHSDDCYCHYLPNLILVRPDDRNAAVEALRGEWVEPDRGELCQILEGADHRSNADVVASIGVLRAAGDRPDDELNPHEAAGQLEETGIHASPVHGVGYAGHGGFQGSQWTPANIMLKPPRACGDEGIIAVVDSGVSTELTPWMDDPNVIFERPIDSERPTFHDPVSHGTFVVSLLRRMAPELVISMASARPDPGYMRSSEPYDPPAHRLKSPPTDELNVLGAVLRLIRRHRDEPKAMKVLNLALGGHECAHTSAFYLGLEAACRAWWKAFPKAAIVAAGGNSTCPAPMYPAAFENVKAVAAAREGQARKGESPLGEMKVWYNGTEVGAPHRDWITDAAPGCDIIGLSGQDEDHTIKWSGSSFATAVVSSLIASGGYSPVSDDGIAWSPDRAVTYGDVGGLVP